MAYADQYTLAQDATFLGRVMVAMLTAATQIMAEANNTAGHAARCALAYQVLSNPTVYQPKFAYALVTQGAVVTGVTDVNLQNAVNSIWNAMANYFAN